MLFVIVLIGSVFLRAAVSLANRTMGPQNVEFPDQPKSSSQFGGAESVASSDEPLVDNSNPYAAPATYAVPSQQVTTRAIPEPDFNKAAAIMLVQTLVAGVINFFVGGLMARNVHDGIVFVTILFVNFLVASIVYTLMLPTSYGRAVLVCVFQAVVVMLTAVFFGGIIYVVSLAAAQ